MKLKSVKLNRFLRNTIRDNCRTAALAEEKSALDTLRTVLGDAVYDLLHAQHPSCCTRGPTKNFAIRVGTSYFHFELSSERPGIVGYPELNLNKAITDGMEVLHNKQQSYDVKYRILTKKLDTLLDSVSSTKQLIEIWPESKQFIPVIAESESKTLEKKQLVADVNDILLELGMEFEA